MQATISPHVRPNIEIYTSSDWLQVAADWAYLSEVSARTSFYLTPEWVESWLLTFGEVLKPSILIFRSVPTAVGACLLVSKKERYGGFPLRRVYLNTAGEEPADTPYVEYNDLLCCPGWENAVAAALNEHLKGLTWDEIRVNGCDQGPGLEALRRTFSGLEQKNQFRSCFYVSLARLKQSSATYESTLSANTRAQIARSFKLYRETGEVKTEVAADLTSALKQLEQLIDLHQKSWAWIPGRLCLNEVLDFPSGFDYPDFSAQICADGSSIGRRTNHRSAL